MARVLVIGANGFIGSHLVDALSARGHEVSAFDRYRSDAPLFDATSVRVVVGDFLNRADLERAVAGQDIVFHFLSTTTPATAEGDPTIDLRTNVAQTVELLQACVSASVGRFVFASTGGAIYGSQHGEVFSERDRAMPVSPYAIGKLAIENYLSYFRTKHGLASTVFRISNPYGGRQKPNRVQGLIPIALRRIMHDQAVVRLGDGGMVRDYIYVQDLVAMLARTVGAAPRHAVYNLGSGRGHSVNDVFAALRAVTGVDFAIDAQPKPPTFVERVVLSTHRFSEEFGAVEPTELVEGIRLTYDELRGQDQRGA